MAEFRLIDIGTLFGNWTIISSPNREKRTIRYLCRCICGTERLIEGTSLRAGKTTSCGCNWYKLQGQRKPLLSGEKFGQLEIIKMSETRPTLSAPGNKQQGRKFYYLCRCICGNEVSVWSANLKNGNTASCGCIKAPNLIRRKFNMLTVLELTHRGKNGAAFYKCQCDCGNMAVISGSHLTAGTLSTKSCGCLLHPNLIGQTFGSLTVTELYNVKNQVRYFYCRCKCGQQTIVRGTALTTGKTVSCGCSRFLPIEEFTLNRVFNTYKQHAQRRGKLFQLDREAFRNIIVQNCTYCGSEPEREVNRREPVCKGICYNGIDRIDSKVGYIQSNCVPCCKICNYMKHILTQDQFLEHIRKIYTFSANGHKSLDTYL